MIIKLYADKVVKIHEKEEAASDQNTIGCS